MASIDSLADDQDAATLWRDRSLALKRDQSGQASKDAEAPGAPGPSGSEQSASEAADLVCIWAIVDGKLAVRWVR